MNTYTFHFETQNILKMFSDAFNDVVIKRFNADKEEQDRIHVDFKYAPKTRVLYDLVQKSQHIKLPVISISQSSISRDRNRVFNKLDYAHYSNVPRGSNISIFPQPVPIIMNIDMSIIARYQMDIDQIITNFVPYCDPYVTISMKWPEEIFWADFELRHNVKWSENISYEYPKDIQNTAPYRIIGNTSFAIETWMFKNSPPDGKPIHVIDMSFTSVSAVDTYEFMKSKESEYNTDYREISAIPQVYNCYPYSTYCGADRSIILYGKMLDYTENVYLSSNDLTMFQYTSGISWYYDTDSNLVSAVTANPSYFDLFGNREMVVGGVTDNETVSMSAEYPPFYGYEIYDYKKTENMLTFTNQFYSSGSCDVIVANEAGYAVLSKDSVREMLNPYNEDEREYATYEELQFPCVSGIQIYEL